jgi:putative multiple sugar transport system permease protein
MIRHGLRSEPMSVGGMSAGPFPVVFQRLSSGFIPDVFDGEGFSYTALFLRTASVAAIISFSFRSRANQLKHAVETAPSGLLLFKNGLLAVPVIAFRYLMAIYRGLPNVPVIMALQQEEVSHCGRRRRP